MAALSSLSESTVKTVRLTYQELLELANILDNEKKEKSPKSKSKENLEENESRVVVSPSKDERTNVDKDEESESVVLETKTDSKKTEKRTKEQKKGSKKKGEEKRKHKSRSHSDEKHSGREDDDEVCSHHNKEKREKTTKAEKTQNDSTESSVDVEVSGSLKGKEEKKSPRKRSPKLKEGSGEKTADLEDHVAKLRLDAHGEEEERKKDTEEGNSRKSNKNIKKKTKSSEERDKKHSESKRKDKKKSGVVENSKKDSCEEEGKEKEKRKRKNDNIKIDDNCFEDEHKKQGILKSSPKAKGIHVSFSEDIEDPHSSENNNALRSEERGIIRIPEGIDIHQEDGKIRGSTEFEECLLEIDYHHHDVNDGHDDDDESISQTAEISHDIPYDKGVHHHDNPDAKPIDKGKISTMEKRLKALNRQRAQQLIKQCHHAENSLSNLLSKGISDKGSLHRVCTLSKEIQDLYQGVIMLDLGLANQHDVDQLLWKNAFYQVIETFRKYSKLFLGYSNQKNMMSSDDINKELYQFLETASYFYSDLLGGLQKTYHFEVQDIVSQPRKAEMLGRNAKLALLSCHYILIFLGDIERYKEQLHTSKRVNWGAVRTWYLKASKLAPKNGKPYNQLAVIAVYANRKLDAVYYYVRSLAVSSPILTAKEKLTTIFHEIQRKADQVQQEEEMKRRQQERQRTAHDRRDTPRGHGRNVFKEAAREVGLVAEKEPNNTGRHEIWVFMRQGKCRRLILTNQGKIQPVDATGTPITKEHQQENNHRDPIKESPKISLQEVNKKFMLHFLCAHGLLYTRIGMERLPSLQVQLIGELHTLLGFPQCSSVSYISLLQMSAISMYAIDHTAPRENPEPFIRVGTPQDQALTLAIDMLISVLNACTELLMKPQEDNCHHGNGIELSATLRQFIPAVKVWFDWLTSHQDLWQASSISIHRTLWESIAQFTNLLIQHESPEFEEEEDGEVLVTLREDEFLAGFKPLADAKKYSMTVRDPQLKEFAENHLHIIAVKDFCRLMSSIPNPTLQYCQDTEQYTAVITSIPASQPQNSSSVNVHMDVDHQTPDHQESYESDDVIIESVLEDVESGDEADKGFKELKAKKEKLTRELEDHQEKHSKARAVVHENVSRPHLMSENYPTYLVPDTNCFIDQLSGLQAIVMTGDFTLVVPLVVINELDGLKKDLMIDKYHDFAHAQMVLENSRAAIDFLEDQFSLRSPNVKAVTSKGTVMDTIAFRSEDTTARTGNNDDVILSCCLHYCQENFVNRLATADQPITIRRKVVLLTDDRNLRVKAYTRNVPVLTVPQFRQMARL
ncbi:telomerase-binding protein EST1A-like [Actinia tenebrosa]|uniref:Telomerase-binding protein EST1A-like n=1 Tax=Actinia tenebrosa TaxID=6105 RepID=A0A6P8HLA0_ACTTE|nr:telomerase-binding protein EST1A-like [Actinia tenebrosa]